jgi:restriction endonuclease S subunit
MPTYSCEKCPKLFKQKSHYEDHKNKKTDCTPTAIEAIVERMVDAKIRSLTPYPVLELSGNEEHDNPIMQSFFGDLHNLLWTRAGLNPEKALDHLTFFFAYRLIELQADVLNLPQECRWSVIASIPNENDLFEAIKKGVTSFRSNPKTKPFFKPHEIQKVDIVYQIVNQLNRIPLKTLQETDTLGNIFEYMLGRGMSTMSDEGQYFTNRAICKLAFKLSYNIKKTLRRTDGTLCTFADWFCGTGGFPAAYVNGVKNYLADINWSKDSTSIYCQDMNMSSVTTTLLNLLILTGYPFSSDTIRSSNSFTEPIIRGNSAPFKDIAIDYCFMNPPYGGDKSKSKDYKFAYSKKVKDDSGKTIKKFFVNEDIQSVGIEDDDKVSAGVQLSMATLSEHGGICAIVLPQGFFFGASKKCVEVRKKIAEEYNIHYVVDIASGSFLNTGTKTSMLVFQKGVGSTQSVKFIGLDEKLLIEVTLADLRSKSYSLNYKQYLPQSALEVEGFDIVKIKDILDFQKKPGKLGSADGKDSGKYPFYTCAQKKMYVDTCEFTNTCLIVNRGGMMNVRVDKNFSVSHDDIHVLSSIEGKTSDVTVKYVGHYLKSNIKLLENGMNGTTLKHLNKSFIQELEISLPSLERQQQIVQAIDIWMNLAHQEENTLKMLEQQMMFEVKEMGRGKPRVKLSNILTSVKGKKYPVGEGKDSGKYPLLRSSKDGKVKWMDDYTYEGPYITVGNGGEANFRLIEKFNASTHTLVYDVNDTVLKEFAYYTIQGMRNFIDETCFQGTALENLNRTLFMELEIPIPDITEQHTLQVHFNEIRHKHAKIADYKAKTQEAIRKFIPSD